MQEKIKNDFGETALMWAIKFGTIDIINHLWDEDSLQQKDLNGDDVVFKAVDSEDIKKLEFVLSKGAKLETKNKKGETPLLRASYLHNIDLLKFLVSKGSSLMEKDNIDENLLHYAFDNPKVEIAKDAYFIRDLIEMAPPELFNQANKEGKTPFMYAVFLEGHIDNIEYFFKKLIERGVNINAQDNKGRTALMIFLLMGPSWDDFITDLFIPKICILLKFKPDLTLKDKENKKNGYSYLENFLSPIWYKNLYRNRENENIKLKICYNQNEIQKNFLQNAIDSNYLKIFGDRKILFQVMKNLQHKQTLSNKKQWKRFAAQYFANQEQTPWMKRLWNRIKLFFL